MTHVTSSHTLSKQSFAKASAPKWPVDTKPSFSGQLNAQALRQVELHKPRRVGQPRLNPYIRVLHRLFEPLILLSVLGVTRGAHKTTTQHDAGPNSVTRRRVLRNLCYMCDFEKGGPTTTSIGIEENDNGYKFWVSSNKAYTDKIVSFLVSTLDYLNNMTKIHTKPTEDIIRTLVTKAIFFAKKRITKESKLFFKAINRCADYLDQENSSEDRQLSNWLKHFDEVDILKLCYQAYEDRQCKEVSLLSREGTILSSGNQQSEASKAFGDVKHYLGRLAHHIRAPTQVVVDAFDVSSLLETYSVEKIPTLAGAVRPSADNQTTLKGILKRMLKPNEADRLSQLSDSLEAMDLTLGLTDKIMEEYAQEKSQPVIHCEIQVLEHFYRNKLIYVDNDRYIGCSKPACFCCHLYIQHHPARCVIPDSHQKIYLNWSPPNLELDDRNPNCASYKAQSKLFGKMLETIRTEALDQIMQKAGPKTWHPDSQTGITSIEMVENVFSQLDIGSLNPRETRHYYDGKDIKLTGPLSTNTPPANDDNLLSRKVVHHEQDKEVYGESDNSDGGADI